MVVLTIALGMFSSTLVSTARHSRMKREMAIAAEGGRRTLEMMRSRSFSELFALYDADPNDDPGGAGTAPGPNFAIPGLTPRAADADGLVGQVSFPAVASALRENVADAKLGMPRDLDGDGDVDAQNHAANYILLPVRVRIEWQGVAGDSSFEMYTEFVKL